MNITFHLIKQSLHQQEWGKLLMEGMRKSGDNVREARYNCAEQASDVAVVWSWKQMPLISHMLRRGAHVLVMERGYLQPRREWCALSWDGLAGRGRFAPAADDGKRFREMHKGLVVAPMRRKRNNRVLLVGQVPGDAALNGIHMHRWAMDCAQRLMHRGNEIYFRRHPKVVEREARGAKIFRIPGTTLSTATLEEDLSRCDTVLTLNSNSCVESLLSGAATITSDEGSIAYEVTAHDVDEYVETERQPWLRDLSWRQWSRKEMRSGMAWQHMKSAMEVTK